MVARKKVARSKGETAASKSGRRTLSALAAQDDDDSLATLRAPGLVRFALEWRMPLEYAALVAALPVLRRAPRGDGHPVVVFPGLMAHDITTWALRRYLYDRGYTAHPWGEGFNLGPRDDMLERFAERVRDLRRERDQKVSLIGWSLGGIYAREIAKEVANDVRCVITLGSPFTGHPKATNAWRVFELASGLKAATHPSLPQLRVAPPVPTTSIYSRSDGFVAWQCSVQKAGPLTENIEVVSSHFGLGFNPLALYAIADRLAQREDKWQPFERTGLRRYLYRSRS